MRQKRNCLLGKVGLFGMGFSVGMQSESFNSSLSAPRRGGGGSMHLGHLSPHPWYGTGSARELEPVPPSVCFKHGIWYPSRAKPLVRSWFFHIKEDTKDFCKH